MRKIVLIGLALMVSLTIFGGIAEAAFVNPPETNAPAWWTNSPYQRDMEWDFSSDPTTNNPVYAGIADPPLSIFDSVSFTGDVAWIPSIAGVTRSGFIGIDNTNGNVTKGGTATFHLANLGWDNPYKHIWKEIEFFQQISVTLPESDVTEFLGLEQGYTFQTQTVLLDILSEGFRRENVWYEIQPNPSSEDIIFDFLVEAGTFGVVDNLHIATECVDIPPPPIPEPGTMLLLGSLATGLFGMAGIRKRK